MILSKEEVVKIKKTGTKKTFKGMNYWVRPTTNKKDKK